MSTPVIAKCTAVVRNGRIQLLINKEDVGYEQFSKVLDSINEKGDMTWYGDVTDENGNERSGLIITADIDLELKIAKDSELPKEIFVSQQEGSDEPFLQAAETMNEMLLETTLYTEVGRYKLVSSEELRLTTESKPSTAEPPSETQKNAEQTGKPGGIIPVD